MSSPETSTRRPIGRTGDRPEKEYRRFAGPLVVMLNTVPNPPAGPGGIGMPPACVVPTRSPLPVNVSSEGVAPNEPPKNATFAKFPAASILYAVPADDPFGPPVEVVA